MLLGSASTPSTPQPPAKRRATTVPEALPNGGNLAVTDSSGGPMTHLQQAKQQFDAKLLAMQQELDGFKRQQDLDRRARVQEDAIAAVGGGASVELFSMLFVGSSTGSVPSSPVWSQSYSQSGEYGAATNPNGG